MRWKRAESATDDDQVRDWQEVRATLLQEAEQVASFSERALARLRKRRGLTQRDVANEMEVSQARIAAIEGRDMASTEIGTIERYVQALGGRLSLVVDVDGDTFLLR